MEKKFNEQDSLKLINEMITQAKNNFQKGAGNSIIFWGYSIASIAILNIVLLYIMPQPRYSFWIWTLTIPLSVISRIVERKREKEVSVRSHFDRIISRTWHGFLISVVVTLSTIFLSVYCTKTWTLCILITPILLILTGLAQYITGIASRFTPFVIGGYTFWCGAVLSILILLVSSSSTAQFVILAISMIFGFIAPGHMLNKKAEQNV